MTFQLYILLISRILKLILQKIAFLKVLPTISKSFFQLLGDNFQFNSNSVVIGVNNLYFVLKSCVVKTMVTDTATLLPSYDFINPLKSFSKFSLGRLLKTLF